jgi:hypothetical protein
MWKVNRNTLNFTKATWNSTNGRNKQMIGQVGRAGQPGPQLGRAAGGTGWVSGVSVAHLHEHESTERNHRPNHALIYCVVPHLTPTQPTAPYLDLHPTHPNPTASIYLSLTKLYICIYTYTYIYMYRYIYLYIYIHIYTQTHRQADTRTHRHTHTSHTHTPHTPHTPHTQHTQHTHYTHSLPFWLKPRHWDV